MKGIDSIHGRRLISLLFGFLLLLACVAVLTIIIDRATPKEVSGDVRASALGGPFALTAADGRTVTDKTLAGKPYVIFFGFTRCPDICPTSLARMAQMRKALGADGAKFNIIFVSVDPEHDRPAEIGKYVAMFGTPIIGLTGTEAQLAQITKGFGVFVKKVPLEGGDYTIDHTATIYLMNADGSFADAIGQKSTDAEALDKLKRLVS